MHHCAQTFAQMNIWLQSSEYCNAVKWNVSGWYKIVQYSRKGCNCKVQCSAVGMDAIANCAPQSLSLSQTCKLGQIGAWQDFGLRFVCIHRKYFYQDFRFVFHDSCRFNNFLIRPCTLSFVPLAKGFSLFFWYLISIFTDIQHCYSYPYGQPNWEICVLISDGLS